MSAINEIVAALYHLRDHEGAVPSHGRGLHADIKGRYQRLTAAGFQGDALMEAAAQVVGERLAAIAPAKAEVPPPVVTVEAIPTPGFEVVEEIPPEATKPPAEPVHKDTKPPKTKGH